MNRFLKRKLQRYVIPVLLAIPVVLLFFLADHLWRTRNTQIYLQNWSTQLVAQADSLLWVARENKEIDPVSWVVTRMTQGMNPNFIKISKLSSVKAPSADLRLNRKNPFMIEYELQYPLTRENGQGISILMQSDQMGFLGTSSHFSQDLILCFFWLLISGFLAHYSFWLNERFFEFSRKMARILRTRILRNSNAIDTGNDTFDDLSEIVAQINPTDSTATVTPPPIPQIAKVQNEVQIEAQEIKQLQYVRAWVTDARKQLFELGTHMRDVVKQAQTLAQGTHLSEKQMSELKRALLLHSREVRERQVEFNFLLKHAEEIETHCLNLNIELAKHNLTHLPVGQQAHLLFTALRRAKTLQNRSAQNIAQLSELMLPWCETITQAKAHHDTTLKAAADLDLPIQKTTQSLMSQARLLQGLTNDLEIKSGPTRKSIQKAA